MVAEEVGGEEEGAEEVGGRIRRRRRVGSSSISIHHGWGQNVRKCVHSGIDSSRTNKKTNFIQLLLPNCDPLNL